VIQYSKVISIGILPVIFAAATSLLIATESSASDLIGSMTAISAEGRVEGWAVNKFHGSYKIQIRAFVDGTFETGQLTRSVTANAPRAEVLALTGVHGDHGFGFWIPNLLKDNRPHTLKVYALDETGYTELTTSPQTFQFSEVAGRVDGVGPWGMTQGWALDYQLGTEKLAVRAYLDGTSDTGRLIRMVTANAPRPDVNQATRVAGDHGFKFSIAPEFRDDRMHTLRVYALSPIGLVELAPKPTQFKLPDVMGNIDSIDSDGRVVGWALSNKLGIGQIAIRAYLDGDSNTGKFIRTVTANAPRPDVNSGVRVAGDHGYRFSIADEYKDGTMHSLRIYAVGPNGLVEVSGSPTTFRFDKYTFGVQSFSDSRPVGETQVKITDTKGRIFEKTADSNGVALFTVLRGNYHLQISKSDFNTYDAEVFVDHDFNSADTASANSYYLAQLEPSVKLRRGIVRAQGRNFVDDDGPFYPLGQTLFWALRGWKFERERVKQNLDYLKTQKFDYIRILGEVDWAGNEVDPSWPDYEQVLGELMDYAYNKCGLRVELTILGGGHEDQAMSLTQKITSVVKNGREHMVLNFEVANESYQRNISLEDMRGIGRFLRQQFPNHLVALSSAEGTQSYRDTGDFMADFKDVYMRPDSANLGTTHMDRAYGDLGWRIARQPWDFKDQPFPVSHNEPIGPRSSVAEEMDPIRLAMLRAVGIINGVEAFVLHNAAGVAGQVNIERNRPANVWEVPGIDHINEVVRRIDSFLPPYAGDGQHWNNGWAGSPWIADNFWAEGGDHGINRNYSVATPDGWISTESGIMNYVLLTASRHSVIEVFDVLQGKVQEVELQAGETFRLTPLSTDSNGLGAFIVIGHYR
jgi:hypothetical protein